GSILGLILSIPFGNLLLKDISNIIVLNKDNFILINILSVVSVSIIIMLFSYLSTTKVKKLSPIDAIRNGEIGERFKKKGALKLTKSPLKPTSFMSINDVISSPKRYSIIMIAFSLCVLLLLICSISASTLKSEKLIKSFGMSEADLYLSEGYEFSITIDGDKEKLENEIIRIENLLKDNDLAADCSLDIILKPSIKYGKYETKVQCYQGIGNKVENYNYVKGSAPSLHNEIAITKITADKLNVNIGDTITVVDSIGSKEYIITAIFQTMNNMGEGIRFHEDTMLDYSLSYGCMYFQIDFLDDPTDKEIKIRIEKIKELLNTDKIYTAKKFVEIGVGVAGAIDAVKNLVLVVTVVVILLVTVLMEMSFIVKEKNEIAILKAMGFKNFDIIKWHSIRFIFVGFISIAIALLLSYPVTYVSVTPIFKMMGATFGIEYDIKPLDIYVIYPLICLMTTALSAIITALYTNKIKASDATSIE
ncbi:MAG: FtsX-like permease family protein, partial [Acholeplasmatales bacterium]|nr:FtsX-like permease family protein [Acholeplasmatales bacterium]